MIHFSPVEAPDGWEDVKTKGDMWVSEHPDADRPIDYWSPFKAHLADGFKNLCGYGAMYEPVGTVDHFVPWKSETGKENAYNWSNYRFLSGWINSSKQSAGEVLDPYEVVDGWFEIIWPSLQLVATEKVPKEIRAMAEYTLKRLHLQDDERVLRQRQKWLQEYLNGDITIKGLQKNAPLLAAAIVKNKIMPNNTQDGEAVLGELGAVL